MKKNKPLVSVIAPVYNGERHIIRLLSSIMTQSYSPIELFVVNDGSTDGTLSVLESYRKEFADREIRYEIISQNNKGQAAAINKGLKKFSGKYVTFIDSDDYLNNDSIRTRVEFLERYKKFSVVYGRSEEVDADNDYRKVGERLETHTPPRENLFIDLILERNYNWPPVQYLIRSKDFLHVYPSRSIAEFRQGQNIQIFLPLYYHGRVGYINKTLSYISVHTDSHSRTVRSEADERAYQEMAHHIYIDTLRRIRMPKEACENYIAVLQCKYDNRFALEDLQKERMNLSAKLADYYKVKRSARLLAGNIKRGILNTVARFRSAK